MPRLLALSFIWGWSFLFIKVAGEELTPTAVAGGRCLLGALVLLTVLRLQGLSLPRGRMLGHFLVVGTAGSALPFALLAWGEQHIDSGLTAVLNASTPLFTAALAVPLLGERARPRVVAGLVVGFAGVGIVSGIGGADLTGTDVLAALAPVAAGACYGFTFCWAARHLLGIPPLVAAAGQVTAAAVVMAPIAAVTSVAHGVVPGWRAVGSLLLLGAIGTGLAYVLSFRVIADLGPTVASLCTYIIPVVALLVGWAVLDEQVTVRIVVGGLVIVASVLVVTRDRGRGQRPVAGDTGGSPVPAAAASPSAPVQPSSARRVRRRAVLAGAGLLVTTVAVGCGGDGDAACEPVRREPLDSRAVHVLPGADAPEYLTDPPTSGPAPPRPSRRLGPDRAHRPRGAGRTAGGGRRADPAPRPRRRRPVGGRGPRRRRGRRRAGLGPARRRVGGGHRLGDQAGLPGGRRRGAPRLRRRPGRRRARRPRLTRGGPTRR